MLCVFLLMYSSAVVVRYSLTIPFKPSTSTKHHTRDGVRNSPTRDQSKGQCTDYLNLFQASDFHQLLQLNGCLPGSEIAICFVLCCGIGASANVKKPFRQRRATNSLTNEWPLLVLRIFIEMVQINVCTISTENAYRIYIYTYVGVYISFFRFDPVMYVGCVFERFRHTLSTRKLCHFSDN